MITITQIYPVPQGRNYYAVYTDERRKSGYRAERVDFLVLVKKQILDFTLEGLSGNMMKPAGCYSSYRGTFSENALKSELPELWEEIKASGDFAVEPTLWEKFITEQRDTLLFQNEQINLLKEKIAALENVKADTEFPEITPNEMLFGKERTDFDFPNVLPNDDKYPFDTDTDIDTLLNGDTFDTEDSGEEITETVSNRYPDGDARNITLCELRDGEGKGLSSRALTMLSRLGYKTLGDVAESTFSEIFQNDQIGIATMKNILSVLWSHGLSTKDEMTDRIKSVVALNKCGITMTQISRDLNIPYGLVQKYLDFAKQEMQELDGGKIT